jgi:hypothetical protein
VVVHLLYQTDAQNISDAHIKSGIDALNRDFRRKNADTANTPQRFRQFAADVQIEFALATSDPRGVATTGIIRKRTSVKEWAQDDKIKQSKYGGDDAWDASQYFNIWIGNMPRSLGYASLPGGPLNLDGVVITTTAFGTIGKSGGYNMGRTLVHETGHWLGLKHIWGDADCGDDGIADTPPQSGFTSGCPNYFLSSCNNGSLGDMYMNYMDFTHDACMNLFTKGQKEKMRSLFVKGGLRYSLLSSKGLLPPTLEEAPVVPIPIPAPVTTSPVPAATKNVQLYPVPAGDWLTISFPGEGWVGAELQVINQSGAIAKRVVVTSLQQKVPLLGLAAGVYFIHGRSRSGRIAEKFIKTGLAQ